jgi:1-acyl-sn-glycerol-3-phosphate acyltransferase
MRFFARMWHRCRAEGLCPLPAQGPAIVVANHPSHCDPCFLLAGSRRVLHFLHAREYYDVPLLRRLFRRIGCIPVGRDGRDRVGLRRALRCLEAGGVLAVFPEGEISCVARAAGLAPKGGAALLALRSRAPVFPAYIDGGPEARSSVHDWLWPSHGVRVFFGPAIDLTPFYDRRIDRRLLQKVTNLLMERIAALRPNRHAPQRAQSSHPAQAPVVRAG